MKLFVSMSVSLLVLKLELQRTCMVKSLGKGARRLLTRHGRCSCMCHVAWLRLGIPLAG
jgi:hypothetical protein